MDIVTAEILLRFDPVGSGYLPEGPIAAADDQFTWVGIQHGANSVTGSLNRFDWATRKNQTIELDGRPGFAIPGETGEMYIGLERRLIGFRWSDQQTQVICDGIEAGVSGTIINDGAACRHGLIFGCKDLEFSNQKAGLYFWRREDGRLFRLRSDQVCSNGKVIVGDEETITFLDIDTPTRQVVNYNLDPSTGEISDPVIVLELGDEPGFPDGMVATPDGLGVIIALFNPGSSEYGQARWYDLATGEVRGIWKTPGSPQVTCPMLQRVGGEFRLVLTTAAENMDASRRQENPNAGCLFVAPTPF